MPSAAVKVPEDNSSVETDPFVRISGGLERKIRNLERRKYKLGKYREELEKGGELDQDQNKAVQAYDSVVASISLCQEFSTQINTAIEENEKLQKSLAKKRQEEKSKNELERYKQILKFLDVLARLGNPQIRDDFLNGNNGAIKLPEEKLDQISQLGQHFLLPTGPERSTTNSGLKEQLSNCAENLSLLLDGKNKPVVNTTYREMRSTIVKIANTTYPKPPKKEKSIPPTPTDDTKKTPASPEPQVVPEAVIQHPISLGVHIDTVFIEDAEKGTLTLDVPRPANDASMLVSPPHLPTGIIHSTEMYDPDTIQKMSMDVNDLVSGSFNFLQESQVSPEGLEQDISMDPAVVGFGHMKPESLIHMHEQQKMVHLTNVPEPECSEIQTSTFTNGAISPPISSSPAVAQAYSQQMHSAPQTQYPAAQVLEERTSPAEKPQSTSWADDAPSPVARKSPSQGGNVWHDNTSSEWGQQQQQQMNWAEESDDRSFNAEDRRGGYRGRGQRRGNNNFRGRGYGYSNGKVNTGGFNGNGYRGSRGSSGGSYRGNRPARGNGGHNAPRGFSRGRGGGYQNSRPMNNQEVPT